MPDTRRDFLHTAAAIAAGAGGAAALWAQAPPRPASEVQVPKMKFGKHEISRLICGCNPFYGYAHFNATLGAVMREYYTPERVREVLHQCNRFGIDTFNYHEGGRGRPDLEAFLAEGGRMHGIAAGRVGGLLDLAAHQRGNVAARSTAVAGRTRVSRTTDVDRCR